MVWSAASGTSIILPTDHITGDGKNYLIIGDDVPSEVASRISAGIVFRTYYPTVEAAGDAKNVWYWVFGIDIDGALVLTAYYAVKMLAAGAYLYERLTMFRMIRNAANGTLNIDFGYDSFGDSASVGQVNINAPLSVATINGTDQSDTGWVGVTLGPGFAATGQCVSRVLNGYCTVAIVALASAGWAAGATLATLNAGVPPFTMWPNADVSGSSSVASVSVTTAGLVKISTAFSGSQDIRLLFTFPV